MIVNSLKMKRCPRTDIREIVNKFWQTRMSQKKWKNQIQFSFQIACFLSQKIFYFFWARMIRKISIVIQVATDRVPRSQNNVPIACCCQPVFGGNSVKCQHRLKDILGKEIHLANCSDSFKPLLSLKYSVLQLQRILHVFAA